MGGAAPGPVSATPGVGSRPSGRAQLAAAGAGDPSSAPPPERPRRGPSLWALATWRAPRMIFQPLFCKFSGIRHLGGLGADGRSPGPGSNIRRDVDVYFAAARGIAYISLCCRYASAPMIILTGIPLPHG